ncbi:helix-turn-helix transcriptional regulator [Planctomicrobium piriforme]|uniref:helix-turn-helix transcriptional regulator n=1 Tax=Planctomicrobium piriforme TaxID=1576369 RepID=UPI001587C28B|nr:transcriptional regulator [Planctomicrobium piriforme]
MRQADRIARVLGVLNLIQSRGQWTLQAIAEELGCSDRTVRRDLEVLEFAGIPFYKDERTQCYRVRPDFRFPTLTLTLEEALGQAIATAASSAAGLNISEGAGPTTRKLTATSSEQIQQILSDAARLIEVFDLKIADHSRHDEAIKTAQFALLQGKQLTGLYSSPYESQTVKLRLHPYRLCLIKRAWYLIGHLDGESQPKTLRIARFKSLRMLDQAAHVPADFDLRSFLGNAWSVYRGDQSYEVELRFLPPASSVVTETVWHHTQKAKLQKDGSVLLAFTVDGLEEILHWILSWSGNVQILSPAELRQRYAKVLTTALALNSESDQA